MKETSRNQEKRQEDLKKPAQNETEESTVSNDETPQKAIIDSNKPSYKNPPNEVAYFSYKRINHFNEWLAQFQAKESTDIPSDVYDKIILEIKTFWNKFISM